MSDRRDVITTGNYSGKVRLVTRHLVHLEPEVPLAQVPELVEFALSKSWGRPLLGVDVRGEGDFWQVWIVQSLD